MPVPHPDGGTIGPAVIPISGLDKTQAVAGRILSIGGGQEGAGIPLYTRAPNIFLGPLGDAGTACPTDCVVLRYAGAVSYLVV
jgi:hypothetical protein